MSHSSAAKLYPVAAHELHAEPATVRSSSGATASVVRTEDRERLEVRDSDERLLFTLDTATGRAEVWAPAGDLALRTRGRLELEGASVSVRGTEEVRIEAGQGASKARLLLTELSSELRSSAMKLAADRAELAFRETHSVIGRLRSKIDDAALVAVRLETTTERLFERARTVFRTVEGVHQLVAGRSRTLLEGAYELRASRASIDAEGDVKIDGKQIHLG